MTKNQWIDKRTKIISKMLDNPQRLLGGVDIYPTTEAFAELDDLFDELNPQMTPAQKGASWAQIDRDNKRNNPCGAV